MHVLPPGKVIGKVVSKYDKWEDGRDYCTAKPYHIRDISINVNVKGRIRTFHFDTDKRYLFDHIYVNHIYTFEMKGSDVDGIFYP